MNSYEFVNWLGSELRLLDHLPIDLNLLDASCGLVNTAIEKLSSIPVLDQKEILKEITAGHRSGTIGNFQIPFDDRDKIDIVEAILGTIKGSLEDQNLFLCKYPNNSG
jgi:hypothetical protein